MEGWLEVSQVQPLLEVDVQLGQPLTRPHVDRVDQNSLKADLVASYHRASHAGWVIETTDGRLGPTKFLNSNEKKNSESSI